MTYPREEDVNWVFIQSLAYCEQLIEGGSSLLKFKGSKKTGYDAFG